MRGSTAGSTRLPGVPSIHLAMVQGHGNRSLGTPDAQRRRYQQRQSRGEFR